MVLFQHISETTECPFLLVFLNGRVGRGSSSCTVENWQSSTNSSPLTLDLELLSHALPPSSICLHPSFYHCLIVFSMEGTNRKRPRYSCPVLKDDVVGELIDRCDIITSASMAGSFKTILDSTNNIITSVATRPQTVRSVCTSVIPGSVMLTRTVLEGFITE